MKPRSAFTLVELLMSLTMGGSVMLLAIGLVHQSMSMSKLSKVRWEHDQSTARLAQQFRNDVHFASALTSASADLVELKLTDDSTITYKCEAARVIWEKTSSGSEVARELFQFDEGSRVTFSKEANPERVALQLVRQSERTEFPSRVELRVVSIVGRWQQLERSGGSQP